MATASDAAFAHHREQRLEVGGLGGGALALDALVADPGSRRCRSARCARRVRGPQPAFDQVGGGGLARGAGDADLQQVAGRARP